MLIRTKVSDASGNSNNRLNPGETVNLTAFLKNIGGADFTNLTTTIQSADPYITITDNSGNFGALKIDSVKENTGDPYVVSASLSTPMGYVAPFRLIASQGGYVDTFQFELVIGSYHYLIYNPDPTPLSGWKVDSILTYLGFTGVYSTSLPTKLSMYEAIFVCNGIYWNNRMIYDGSAEANTLLEYLNNEGMMYMEGGDVWYYDPVNTGYDFGPHFGISGLSNGSNDLGPVIGQSGTFTNGMSFTYGGENNSIDRITPVGTGFLIFRDGDNLYNCGIANNAGTYKTVGTSFELGLLTDGSSPSTRAALLDSIMNFFDVNFVDAIPPRAPYVTQVTKSGSNAILTWRKVITDTLSHAETTSYYVVYRSTSPSFVPGPSDSIGRVVHPDTAFTDIGVLSTLQPYYYLVKAVDKLNNRSRNSNIAYVFKKQVNENAMTTDRNWVSIPWYTTNATISVLTNDLSPAGDPLIKVTNLRNDQFYESWLWDPDFGEWYGTDFAIQPGRGYELVTIRDDTLVLVGSNNPHGVVLLNENPLTTDRNWVSIPYNHAYGTVSDVTAEYSALGNPLIKCTNLRDDNFYESWLWDPDFGEWYGTDFTIDRGRGYEFVTVVDTTWDPTEFSNEAGMFLVRKARMSDMHTCLGTASQSERAPVWSEDEEVNRGSERARCGVPRVATNVSHIVRICVDMLDCDDLVFTAYRPTAPYDVLTEAMIGSGIAEKDGSASLSFDVGNFRTAWSHGEEILLIIEAVKNGSGYFNAVSFALDNDVDVQALPSIALIRIPEPLTAKNTVDWQTISNPDVIGYSLYKDEMRLNDKIISTNRYITAEKVCLRPVIRGGYETVYSSGGVQATPKEHVPVSYTCAVSPNPCTRNVRIEYAVPSKTLVDLVIYDVSGRQVRSLFSGQCDAGYYAIFWDGTDGQGARVSSGMYFFRFETNEYRETEKLLMVR